MKSYTDIGQSKKLAEILPIESADMWYCPYPNEVDWYDEPRIGKADLLLNQLPCWSLAALLGVISYPTLSQEYNGKWSCMEFPGDEEVEGCENPVDACYEMILELNEQKLL
jgi:hypothetical protein